MIGKIVFPLTIVDKIRTLVSLPLTNSLQLFSSDYDERFGVSVSAAKL